MILTKHLKGLTQLLETIADNQVKMMENQEQIMQKLFETQDQSQTGPTIFPSSTQVPVPPVPIILPA